MIKTRRTFIRYSSEFDGPRELYADTGEEVKHVKEIPGVQTRIVKDGYLGYKFQIKTRFSFIWLMPRVNSSFTESEAQLELDKYLDEQATL
jgi:hypothetical protein